MSTMPKRVRKSCIQRPARPTRIEHLEPRIVFSAYAFHALSTILPFAVGSNPVGVVADSSGNLYGNAGGTVYEIAHGTHAYSSRAFFNVNDGLNGIGVDPAGDIFGSVNQGLTGNIFEVAHGTSVVIQLASFYSTTSHISGRVVVDSSGNLFGTTLTNPNTGGAIFELAHGSHAIANIVAFGSGGFAIGLSNLTIDPAGDLYASVSNTAGKENVFEIPHGTHTVNILAAVNAIGSQIDSLVLDSNGDVFGTTNNGLPNTVPGDGVIFEIAHATHTAVVLAAFNGANGAAPESLVIDSSGDLFGTTNFGGTGPTFPGSPPSGGSGTIFELAHATHTIKTLASFIGTNGAGPFGSIVLDSSGNLYGTGFYGGSTFVNPSTNAGFGDVYILPHASHTITRLFSFNPSGFDPDGGVIRDSSGNLYGESSTGGATNFGFIYELAHGASTITILASFTDATGFTPIDGLVMDTSGNLYGSTTAGGSSKLGGIFEPARQERHRPACRI